MTRFPSGPPAPSAGAKAPPTDAAPGPGTDDNKFRLVTLASQRCKQLQNGARPRVEPGDHKAQRIATLEVIAGAISWSLTELPVRVPA
jgi:DNA-directed RNA polymerase omega subunit